jgi:hypothetical protein
MAVGISFSFAEYRCIETFALIGLGEEHAVSIEDFSFSHINPFWPADVYDCFAPIEKSSRATVYGTIRSRE